MKFHRRHRALIVESETLVKLAGLVAIGKSGLHSAKAAAFFPFVFVRKAEYATPIFVNHERIHFRQQLETLFVGVWLITIFEDVYSRLFLKLSAPDYYLYRAVEQEAYRNQTDLNYLDDRKWFSFLRYFKNKQKLTFVEGKSPEVLVGKRF